jgi:hypothetical protein
LVVFCKKNRGDLEKLIANAGVTLGCPADSLWILPQIYVVGGRWISPVGIGDFAPEQLWLALVPGRYHCFNCAFESKATG